MTDAQKIEKLKALVEKRAHDGSQSPANAKALLVEEGIYDKNGKLTREYGGKEQVAA